MKKSYFLVLLFALTNSIIFGQAKVFDNSGSGDGSWNEDANWADGTKPISVSSDIVETAISVSQLDYDLEIKSLDLTSGDVQINGPNTLTIDVNTAGTSSTNNETSAIIYSANAAGNNFKMNTPVIIENSLSGRSYFKNQNSQNTFTLSSSIDLKTPLRIDNAGVVNMSGTITQSVGDTELFFEGAGTYNLNAGFDANAVRNLRIGGSGITLNVNDQGDALPVYDDFITSQNGSDGSPKTYTAVINSENAFQLKRWQFFNYTITNITINENQNDFGELRLFLESDVNLTIAAGKSVNFDGNAAQLWGIDSELYITGYDFDGANPSNIRFGSSSTSLDATQIAKIVLVGGANPGEAVTLDMDGYLILAATASASSQNSFDFKIHPNPVQNELSISTEESIISAQILDLLGNTVLSAVSIEGSLDVSNLTSGVYVIRLTSESGVATSKFVKE